jgi:hypothetical protein
MSQDRRPSQLIARAAPALALAVATITTAASAQPPARLSAEGGVRTHARCVVLCAPTLTLMPGVLRTHLARGPLVRATSTGVEQRLPETSSFQVTAVAAAKTPIPRLSGFASVQWLPNASAQRNPFTLYTASQLGDRVRANAPALTVGVSAALLEPQDTGGWTDLAVNVGDLFSHAARPDDKSDYTHKLDLNLVTHLHAFAWAPPETYLHRTSIYALLDYVASGLARRGDEVPAGRVFVTDARPLALLVGVALPLTAADR